MAQDETELATRVARMVLAALLRSGFERAMQPRPRRRLKHSAKLWADLSSENRGS